MTAPRCRRIRETLDARRLNPSRDRGWLRKLGSSGGRSSWRRSTGPWPRLDDDSAAMLYLVGEPGIGKTRLLAELQARAHGLRHLVLGGRAAEFERDLPFGLFVAALDDYLASLTTTSWPPWAPTPAARRRPSWAGSSRRWPTWPRATPAGLQEERYRDPPGGAGPARGAERPPPGRPRARRRPLGRRRVGRAALPPRRPPARRSGPAGPRHAVGGDVAPARRRPRTGGAGRVGRAGAARPSVPRRRPAAHRRPRRPAPVRGQWRQPVLPAAARAGGRQRRRPTGWGLRPGRPGRAAGGAGRPGGRAGGAVGSGPLRCWRERRSRASRSSPSWRPPPPGWRRPRRSTSSTSWSGSTWCARRRSPGASASGTRSSATASTSPPGPAGASPPTAASPSVLERQGASPQVRAHHVERSARPGDAQRRRPAAGGGPQPPAPRAPATASRWYQAALRLLAHDQYEAAPRPARGQRHHPRLGRPAGREPVRPPRRPRPRPARDGRGAGPAHRRLRRHRAPPRPPPRRPRPSHLGAGRPRRPGFTRGGHPQGGAGRRRHLHLRLPRHAVLGRHRRGGRRRPSALLPSRSPPWPCSASPSTSRATPGRPPGTSTGPPPSPTPSPTPPSPPSPTPCTTWPGPRSTWSASTAPFATRSGGSPSPRRRARATCSCR